MSLVFSGDCSEGASCALVYYVRCAGELLHQRQEGDAFLFRENITENADECFSGATVRMEYQGQDHPMTLTWVGEDGEAVATAELHHQHPSTGAGAIPGLGEEVGLLRDLGTVDFGFAGENGTLWIPQSNRGTVLRVDAGTRRVVSEITVGDPSSPSFGIDPSVVAVSGDQVWVTQRADRALGRIDPATNRIVETIPLGVEPYDIEIDGTTLWVTAFEENAVLKVDSRSRTIVTIPDIANPLGIAVGGGAIWVVEHRIGNLARIDPATAAVTDRIPMPIGSTPENLVFLDEYVWVANNFGNSLSRVDTSTNQMTVIELPGRAVSVSAGGGFVWVAVWPSPAAEVDLSKYGIARIDPASNVEVDVFPFPGAMSLIHLDGILWIGDRNDMSGDKVHAIRLEP
ncbi:MAG: hypothetical protein HZA58_02745 [Acidimicrobiia bacterium]|nr:hypothetical protein [Acidimicrobiia bacterium]